MSNLRSQPQAKYKLLLENASPPVSATRSLVVFVLILSVIGASGIAVFLAWESLSSVQETDFLLRMVEISKNKTVPIGKWQSRTYFYGIALKNNMNTSTWVSPELPAKSLVMNDALQSPPEPKLVCYYTIPVMKTDLQPHKIDPFLCTHINIAFAYVSNSTIINSPGDEEIYRQVVALKNVNPFLKVLLSIGGFTTTVNGFALMVSSQNTRNKFINSTLSWLVKYNLDGVDFDWEFPAWQSDSVQRSQFAQLLKELRREIEKRKLVFLLITVAVAAPQPIVDQAYDVPAMAKYVDFVNVMAYDYHFYVWYLPMTGLNAPLYVREKEEGYMRTLNTNYTAWYWLSKGMPAEKIIMGLPTYGHSFTLVNEKNHGLSAPASGYGVMGLHGFTSYADICWFLTDGEGTSVFDVETKTPYAYRGREWISYDDEQSLSYKAEFVTNNHFGGAMILSLNTDDHLGECSGGKVKFPLTRRVADTLQDDQL